MISPSTGALLRFVRTQLEAGVLPHLESEDAVRQLRAALHILGRIERSWDLAHAYYAADNADIEAVLDDLPSGATPAIGSNEGERLIATGEKAFNDAGLARLTQKNRDLHAALEEAERALIHSGQDAARADARRKLDALYRRMITRQLILVGDAPPDASL